MKQSNDLLEVTVGAMEIEANHIACFEFLPAGESQFVPFTAGAHVDVHLPNGMIRSYSLCNSQDETERYMVAVRREAEGRGGSVYMHDHVTPGMRLTISKPRNNFPLVEDADESIFIAGGIGITPIWSMIQRLEQLQSPWRLYFCARTPDDAAFRDKLQVLSEHGGKTVTFNYDQVPGGAMLDIADVVAGASPGAHLYCCGPAGMLEAFKTITAGLPSDKVHMEYFSADIDLSDAGGFVVKLARSNLEFTIPPGKTILQVLMEAGLDVPHSCEEGVCGSCETAIVEGQPDHRDLILDDTEKASNATMMICCSGSLSPKLVLDL